MPIPTVDAIAETDIALDGSVAVVDTFTLVPGTSKVAVVGQNNASQNYIYNVPASGAWTRDTTNWPAASATFPNEFAVKSGSPANKGSRWVFDNRTTPTLGTDNVDIVRWSWPRALGSGSGLTFDAGAMTLDLMSRGILPGTYERATFNEQGLATAVFSSQSGATQIEGLRVLYDGAAALTVNEGVAWVPGAGGGAGALVSLTSAASLTGLSLTSGTWYYLYLAESGGTGVVEISSQRPASPYFGGARVKGGPDNVDPDVSPDLTRRYIPRSAIYATAANTMRRFQVLPGGLVRWVVDQDLLSAFAATASLNLVAEASIASFVPPTADAVLLYAWLANSTNASSLYVTAADDGLMPTIGATAPNAGQLVTNPVIPGSSSRASASGPIALGASKALRFHQSAGAGSSNNGDVLGFWEAM